MRFIEFLLHPLIDLRFDEKFILEGFFFSLLSLVFSRLSKTCSHLLAYPFYFCTALYYSDHSSLLS